VAQHERLAHLLAAQVEVAVAQPRVLADLAGNPSIWKGGVSASASSSAPLTFSSTAPVGRSGLTVSGERSTTAPQTLSTSSARSL